MFYERFIIELDFEIFKEFMNTIFDRSWSLTDIVFSTLCTPPPHIQGSLNMFPDFFRMSTSIDSTQMKL